MNSKIIETFQQLVHKTSNELKTTKYIIDKSLGNKTSLY